MRYSRQNPSPRYLGLVTQYQMMHVQGETFLGIPPEQTFPGQSLLPHAERIKDLIDRHTAKALLDYGAGKGFQYRAMPLSAPDGRSWSSVQEFWGVQEIRCYDPCYVPFSELPTGKFDAVISTDVLEHCPEEDMEWILDEMFGYATKFVYANVACYPAKKRLPGGENAHITVYPKEWWEAKIRAASARHPAVAWEFWIQHPVSTPQGSVLAEEKLAHHRSFRAVLSRLWTQTRA